MTFWTERVYFCFLYNSWHKRVLILILEYQDLAKIKKIKPLGPTYIIQKLTNQMTNHYQGYH